MSENEALRRAEAEIERLNSELLQGQKLQTIGQLTASIVHEINSPLGYILTNLGMLREYLAELKRILSAAEAAIDRAAEGGDAAALREEYRRIRAEAGVDFLLADFAEAVEDSREGGERIREIVKSLREFTHVDDGHMVPTDLNAVIDGSIRMCANEVRFKATLHRDYGVLPPVVCAPHRMGQVIVNLLVNAAQAIEKKGEIHVSTRADGEEAVIRVRDNGVGMAPEVQRQLFRPFFTTKPVGKGTGLGLHMCERIVRAHGGRIDVWSQPGQGSEFTVRFPMRGPASEKKTARFEVTAHPGRPGSSGAPS